MFRPGEEETCSYGVIYKKLCSMVICYISSSVKDKSLDLIV